MELVVVRVKLPDGEFKEPQAKLDAGEHIIQRLVPLSELYKTLKSYEGRDGYLVRSLGAELMCRSTRDCSTGHRASRWQIASESSEHLYVQMHRRVRPS